MHPPLAYLLRCFEIRFEAPINSIINYLTYIHYLFICFELRDYESGIISFLSLAQEIDRVQRGGGEYRFRYAYFALGVYKREKVSVA